MRTLTTNIWVADEDECGRNFQSEEDNCDFPCLLTATPSEVPDLGHNKKQSKRRVFLQLHNGRLKILKGKKGGDKGGKYRWKDPWDKWENKHSQGYQSRLRRDQRKDLLDAMDHAKEIFTSERRQLIFASYGGYDDFCLT